MIFMGPTSALSAANDNVRQTEGYARLMRSLDGLLEALDRQSVAVADFKGNCATLELSVDRCAQRFQHYKDKIDAIDVTKLKRASEELSQTAGFWADAEEVSE
ncbi:hypothetical protein [Rhodospirillum sp. A1_3_36]|uniref:hypothetical protein n=1 Tax=Rhodospirillum sp. A1_3_36 TaxID=3391666 RepID=UPI0039A49965